MDDSILRNRRRFLEGMSVAGATLLAGCSDQMSGDTQSDMQTQTGTSAPENQSAAAIAAVDQQAMQEEQVTIRKDYQNGNMTREEAQTAMNDLQDKYVGAAIDSLTNTVEGTGGVSVGRTYDSFGAVTLEGRAGAILGVLNSDDATALVPVADLEAQVTTQSEQTTSSS